MTTDELIDRLQQRAADPARRVDAPQTEFGAMVSTMGVGDLFGMVRSLAGDLAQVVDANQAGRSLDPNLVQRADRLGHSATTPIETPLPAVADPSALDRAETALGQRLPSSFRRIYAEVADGGFGPGSGLSSIDMIVVTYRELLDDPPAPRGLTWPPAMVPLLDRDPGFVCLELPGGRIIDWDPERTSEWQRAEGWARSFRPLAPDIEAWLGAWVIAPTPAEERAELSASMRRQELRRTRQRIAAMTPAEREAIGLPAEGWEDAFVSEGDLDS